MNNKPKWPAIVIVATAATMYVLLHILRFINKEVYTELVFDIPIFNCLLLICCLCLLLFPKSKE